MNHVNTSTQDIPYKIFTMVAAKIMKLLLFITVEP